MNTVSELRGRLIAVTSDAEGLRQAAIELMEESLDAPERERIERLAKTAANGERLLESLPQRRTLSPGYYLWLASVIETVVEPMEAGVSFHSSDLDADEMTTLRAIREARSEFRRMHPPCKGCGKPLADAALERCAECDFVMKQAGRR
jgi:hypothetical protein